MSKRHPFCGSTAVPYVIGLTFLPSLLGPFSKITSSSGMHEMKMGGVLIQVITGDITKETTDVIVNSSNDTFSLQSGKSNLTSVSFHWSLPVFLYITQLLT